VLGSGVLVSELMGRDLVDESRIFLHPLPLGAESGSSEAETLQFDGCTTTTTGVLLLIYKPS
jgi:riboflavin biosynthesis pyrimidine reductase